MVRPLATGGNGGAADQRADHGAGMAVHHVRGVYHRARGRAHIRADDQHVPAAERGRHKQTAMHQADPGVTARADARLRRAGLGVQHGARAVPVPRRGGHSLLGQVLGPFRPGCHGRHHNRHTRAGNIRVLRVPFLPEPSRVQVQVHRVRHQGIGGNEEEAGRRLRDHARRLRSRSIGHFPSNWFLIFNFLQFSFIRSHKFKENLSVGPIGRYRSVNHIDKKLTKHVLLLEKKERPRYFVYVIVT